MKNLSIIHRPIILPESIMFDPEIAKPSPPQ